MSDWWFIYVLAVLVILTWMALYPYRRKDPDKGKPKLPRGLESLSEGKCPDCGHDQFMMGPSAGINRNVECTNCFSRFNVGLIGNTVIHAERI